MNGKGSKPRPTHLARYRRNYQSIDWGHGIIGMLRNLDPLPPGKVNVPKIIEQCYRIKRQRERESRTGKCKGCGCRISRECDYCGECLCEEDGM